MTLVCLAIGSFSLVASANELPFSVDLSRHQPSVSIGTFLVLQDVPASWTVEQVAAEPLNHFSVFDPKKTYRVSIDQAIWLHFRVAARVNPAPSEVVFELPKPYVQHVKFYYLNSNGEWVIQIAGVLTNRLLWPMRGLYPRFQLPPPSNVVQDIYIKVLQFVPIRFSPQLER